MPHTFSASAATLKAERVGGAALPFTVCRLSVKELFSKDDAAGAARCRNAGRRRLSAYRRMAETVV